MDELWRLEATVLAVERSLLVDAITVGRLEAAAAAYAAAHPGVGARAAVADVRRRLQRQRYRLHSADEENTAQRISAVEMLNASASGAVPACLDGVDPHTWTCWRDAVRAGYSSRACLGRAHARGEGTAEHVLACEEALSCLIGTHPVHTVDVSTSTFTRWAEPAEVGAVTSWQYLIGYSGATWDLSRPARAVLVLPGTAVAWMQQVDPTATLCSVDAAQAIAG